jgi:DNA-binding NarL/FixJ family response regulator
MADQGDLSGSSVTRVVVADDQAVVRSGLCMILDVHDDIEVVGEASNGLEALELVAQLEPDVVLMDIRMPGLDGIAATERIARRDGSARVIVLTTYGLDENVHAALRSGAAGFFLKTDPPEQLVEAVRAAAHSDAVLGPDVIRLLVDRFVTEPMPVSVDAPEFERLTDREREVALLVGKGLSNREIADELGVGEGTVKTHVARILTKLHLPDRIKVVIYCYERGLLRPGDNRSARHRGD